MPIELQQFQKSLIYETKAPISNVIADLQAIESLDKLAELQQKKYGKQALYYFLLAVAAIGLIIVSLVVIVNATFLGTVIILLSLTSVGLIAACIYALIKRAKFGKLNVINYRYELAKKVLQMMARDMNATTEVEVRLSFQEVRNKENKTETINHPYKSGWKIDKYEHEWLKIRGQFLDKTRFALSATGISKSQYGWKRSSSGKSKYKTKSKSLGLDILLHLTYPQRRYGAVKILQSDISNAVKLPKLSFMRGLNAGEKSIHMNVRVASQVEDNLEEVYQTITMMFLSLYQVLNLAKVLSKSAKI
ncbi:MAG: hypothetical protein KME23_02590 [Goleter apudmare HA4340-LM2]|jgi:hypothetical protein|nr:hypothetical protein [Goleter apudmare HA4340-LM2]